MNRHIAVISFTRMGDLIQCGPLLRSLKKDAVLLSLIVLDSFRDAARLLPMVDHVVGFDGDHWLPLLDSARGDLPRACRELSHFIRNALPAPADEIYNLSHTPLSATLTALLKPKRAHGLVRDDTGLLTVQGEWFHYLFSVMQDRSANPFNLVEIYRRMHPARPFTERLECTVSEHDHRAARRLLQQQGIAPDRPFIALQPGASSRSRQWPPRYFAELAVALADHGLPAVIVGSKDDLVLAGEIGHAAHGKVRSLAGSTTIGELAAVLQCAQKLISNDTGTLHIAAAVRTPTIGIFIGPAAAKDTAPYGENHLVLEADLPCAPCSYQTLCAAPACARHIRPQDVFRLATAGPLHVAHVAAGMQNVRIRRTRIAADGELRLDPLTIPGTGPHEARLRFFRRFWDTLLLPPTSSPVAAAGSEMETDAFPECGMEVGTLQCIARRAREALGLLRHALTHRLPRAEVASALRAQIGWQDELRALLDTQPALAPFVRFLCVRLGRARTCDPLSYLADLEATATLLSRGTALFAELQPHRQSPQHVCC